MTLRTPDLPEPIHLFQRDGKVVLAYGDAGGAATRSTRASKLGDTRGTPTRARRSAATTT